MVSASYEIYVSTFFGLKFRLECPKLSLFGHFQIRLVIQ